MLNRVYTFTLAGGPLATVQSLPSASGSWTDITSALTVLVAAVTFCFGVSAWKRAFVGRRRIQLAEELLARFYEVEDVIREIRNPMSWGGEGKSRIRDPRESSQDSDRLDRAYVVVERYQRHQRFIARLRALRYRSMARFGREGGAPFDEIHAVLNEILTSAHFLGVHYWKRQGEAFTSKEEFERHLEEMHKCEADIWNKGKTEDAISRRVASAVHAIEVLARPEFHALEGFWRRTIPKLARTD